MELDLTHMQQNAFCNYNHISIISRTPDHAVAELIVQPESCNSIDVVHGGLLFSMGDTASGNAARTDGRRYVTQNASFHFIRNVGVGHTVHARAEVRHRGRTTCIVEVIFHDEDERLLAMGEYTFFCIG